jgi:small subunit ribosomal protein S17
MPRRILSGEVVSDKMDKTIVLKVERKVKHPLYNKYVKKAKKYHAHDEDNSCKIGDTVRIIETKPFSKTKQWIVLKEDGKAKSKGKTEAKKETKAKAKSE